MELLAKGIITQLEKTNKQKNYVYADNNACNTTQCLLSMETLLTLSGLTQNILVSI
jgi:hypothetical protein